MVNSSNELFPFPSSMSRRPRPLAVSILVKTAMWISRSRWFSFLRRIFHYHQIGMRLTDSSPSNPLNCGVMVAMELLVLAVQMIAITVVGFISRHEKPLWLLRVWIAAYFLGKVFQFPLLYWRFRNSNHANQTTDSFDLELASEHDDDDDDYNNAAGVLPSISYRMNTCGRFLDLFFAIWFVIGNIWVFDSRFGSFHNAPKLQYLCISILTWNAMVYSIPFLLFVLLCCCCIPFISMMGSVDRGASEDQITCLPHWKFKSAQHPPKRHYKDFNYQTQPEECCICLSNYQEDEEVRQLPCSHLFHLRCVDHWLRIISCCPLCKQQLEREAN